MAVNLPGLNPVIISTMRRVMPSIIARSIVGVSPMSGPVGRFFALHPRGRHRVDRAVYRHFLRLYDRRKTQGDADLAAANYHRVDAVPWEHHAAALAWCRDRFGQHGFLRLPFSSAWWFVERDHAVEFSMVWC
jgi:hypothetical protein